MSVLVFSEKKELLWEMLGKASELAEGNGIAIAAGWGNVEEYAKHGADKVFIIDELDGDTTFESVVPALNSIIEKESVTVVMIGATKRGKEIAARLGAIQNAMGVTDCRDIRINDSAVITKRSIYGGMAILTEKITKLPVIVTVPPRTFKKNELEKAAIFDRLLISRDERIKVLERRPNEVEDVNVEDADILIVVGRGVEKQEDLALFQELAEVVGGTLACTRPIAEDNKWMSPERFIGHTGKMSKAKLVFSVATSGQVQYVAGIRDAEVAVAINNDDKALIWRETDYGIIGDLYETLPALTEAFRKALK